MTVENIEISEIPPVPTDIRTQWEITGLFVAVTLTMPDGTVTQFAQSPGDTRKLASLLIDCAEKAEKVNPCPNPPLDAVPAAPPVRGYGVSYAVDGSKIMLRFIWVDGTGSYAEMAPADALDCARQIVKAVEDGKRSAQQFGKNVVPLRPDE